MNFAASSLPKLLRTLRLGVVDADAAASSWPLKLNLAFNESKDCVISADTNILPRVELGSSLSDNDGSRLDHVAAVCLDAEHLGLRIATVFG